MRVRPLAAVLLTGSLALAACSSFDGSSPDTTTGTVDPNETTTTTTTTAAPRTSTTVPAGSALGLWVVSPAGLADETGTTWVTPAAGETLADPVDDASGGVYYLRCSGEPQKCTIEHQSSADGTPEQLGEAERLIAFGTLDRRPVLLTAWQDPTVTPSFEQNTSGQFARVVDVETKKIVGTYAWFGWESGPFAADVEQDRFALCSGEGEACELSTFDGAAGTPVPVPGTAAADVTSLALDGAATNLTWVTIDRGTGAVVAHRYALRPGGGPVTDIPVTGAATPGPDEAVTDGSWVAVRTGAKVHGLQLDDASGGAPSGPTTTVTVPGSSDNDLEVPADTTQIAIRQTGAGGGVASSL